MIIIRQKEFNDNISNKLAGIGAGVIVGGLTGGVTGSKIDDIINDYRDKKDDKYNRKLTHDKKEDIYKYHINKSNEFYSFANKLRDKYGYPEDSAAYKSNKKRGDWHKLHSDLIKEDPDKYYDSIKKGSDSNSLDIIDTKKDNGYKKSKHTYKVGKIGGASGAILGGVLMNKLTK